MKVSSQSDHSILGLAGGAAVADDSPLGDKPAVGRRWVAARVTGDFAPVLGSESTTSNHSGSSLGAWVGCGRERELESAFSDSGEVLPVAGLRWAAGGETCWPDGSSLERSLGSSLERSLARVSRGPGVGVVNEVEPGSESRTVPGAVRRIEPGTGGPLGRAVDGEVATGRVALWLGTAEGTTWSARSSDSSATRRRWATSAGRIPRSSSNSRLRSQRSSARAGGANDLGPPAPQRGHSPPPAANPSRHSEQRSAGCSIDSLSREPSVSSPKRPETNFAIIQIRKSTPSIASRNTASQSSE